MSTTVASSSFAGVTTTYVTGTVTGVMQDLDDGRRGHLRLCTA